MRLKDLRETVEEMRALGIVSVTLDGGQSITLGLVPAVAAAPAKKVTPRRCACGHSLGSHDAQGVCLKRGSNRAPCSGKCRIIEAGEE